MKKHLTRKYKLQFCHFFGQKAAKLTAKYLRSHMKCSKGLKEEHNVTKFEEASQTSSVLGQKPRVPQSISCVIDYTITTPFRMHALDSAKLGHTEYNYKLIFCWKKIK